MKLNVQLEFLGLEEEQRRFSLSMGAWGSCIGCYVIFPTSLVEHRDL